MTEHTQGDFVEHISCHMCGSSDGMAVYSKGDKVDGYCWSCAKWSKDPYQNGTQEVKPVTEKRIDKYSVREIFDFPSAALKDRGLREETLINFGVKVGLSETDRSVIEHYYPITKEGNTSGYKKRIVDGKKFSSIGDCKGGQLFGQFQAEHIADKRKLYITEGEIDAMTVRQVLIDKNKGTPYEEVVPVVVSITKGAATADKELARQLDFLNQYEKIVLLFDNDESGKEGIDKAVSVLPAHKLYTVKLPSKDANEMLKSGKGAELAKLLTFNVVHFKPVTIVTVHDVIDEALTEPSMGMPWLWPTLNNHTYGRHYGNIYGVGGGVGIGKSTFWFAQCGYDMKKDLGKHGLFMFEESPGDTLKLLAGQVFAKRFNDPTVTITQEERREAMESLSDHIFLCDHRDMLLGSRSSWDEIVSAIRHMALVEGCKHITLDPMTALTAQMSSSEANEFLNGALAQMASLSKQLDICIYYGSHLNRPQRGKPHEEGGRVLLSQLTGSQAMIRWSQYIIGLERDNQDSDPVLANTTWARLLKIRRRFKKEQCLFPIYYNHEDGSYLEVAPDKAGDVPPSERTNENPSSGLRSDQYKGGGDY